MPRIKDLTISTTIDGSHVLPIDNADGTKGVAAVNAGPEFLQLCPLVWTGRYKNLGTDITDAQSTAIKNGTFDGLHIGDYWYKNSIHWRITDANYFLNCGDTNFTTKHLVIVPDESLGNAQMNTENVTTGGWVGSALYSNLSTYREKVVAWCGESHLLTHRNFQVTATSNGYPSAGAWVDTDIDLMNEQMVYGSFIFGNGGSLPTGKTNHRIDKSQLALFAWDKTFVNRRFSYWLKDICSATNFALANGNGSANFSYASASFGVRPAFCIC